MIEKVKLALQSILAGFQCGDIPEAITCSTFSIFQSFRVFGRVLNSGGLLEKGNLNRLEFEFNPKEVNRSET